LNFFAPPDTVSSIINPDKEISGFRFSYTKEKDKEEENNAERATQESTEKEKLKKSEEIYNEKFATTGTTTNMDQGEYRVYNDTLYHVLKVLVPGSAGNTRAIVKPFVNDICDQLSAETRKVRKLEKKSLGQKRRRVTSNHFKTGVQNILKDTK